MNNDIWIKNSKLVFQTSFKYKMLYKLKNPNLDSIPSASYQQVLPEL